MRARVQIYLQCVCVWNLHLNLIGIRSFVLEQFIYIIFFSETRLIETCVCVLYLFANVNIYIANLYVRVCVWCGGTCGASYYNRAGPNQQL